MARQLRIEYEGAFYHVTSRGNRRGKIYDSDKDKEQFLEIMERTKERYGDHLHAYVAVYLAKILSGRPEDPKA